MIGFAGPRVIRETTHQDLPPGFPDRGVSAGARPDRHDRASQEAAPDLERSARVPDAAAVNYHEALQWLYGTQLHGIRLGLENIRRLLEALGVELEAPGGAALSARRGHEWKRLRLRDARLDLPRGGLAHGALHLAAPAELSRAHPGRRRADRRGGGGGGADADPRAGRPAGSIGPPFLRSPRRWRLRHFARERVELAVLETGLGGRLDATNVVTPLISILTAIDLDHQQWLGDDRGGDRLGKSRNHQARRAGDHRAADGGSAGGARASGRGARLDAAPGGLAPERAGRAERLASALECRARGACARCGGPGDPG